MKRQLTGPQKQNERLFVLPNIYLSILRTVFGTEAETRILSLAFAPLKRLKPVFCRWQFKTVRTVDLLKLI